MSRRAARSVLPRALPRNTASSVCVTHRSAKRRSRAWPPSRDLRLRPVLEIMFIDFATLALDCLVNQAAKYRYNVGRPAVGTHGRAHAGRCGGRAAAQHSQSLEAWFIHVPGLVVVAPSSPVEAYGLLKSSIRLGDPVLFVEHKRLYAQRENLVANAELAGNREGASSARRQRCHLDCLLGNGSQRARGRGGARARRSLRRSDRFAHAVAARYGYDRGVRDEDSSRRDRA